MAANSLSEITRNMIQSHLQANIATALADVYTARGDNLVTIEAPLSGSYFNYYPAAAYQAPAIFLITEEIDFRLAAKGANHVNAVVTMHINVVVEDRLADDLIIKAERYQAAIFKLLAERQLTDVTNNVKIVVLVERARFSEEYSVTRESNDPRGSFRKEVSFLCRIEHYESYLGT